MKPIFALALITLVGAFQAGSAATFETTVSTSFVIPNLANMQLANSTMDTDWFTQRDGARTIYSSDVAVGTVDGTIGGNVSAHATWVMSYDSTTRTVHIFEGRTHITNWFGSDRCQVYEDGTCNCHGNRTWNICGAGQPMAPYVQGLVTMAKAASINARIALTNAGYIVIQTPPTVRTRIHWYFSGVGGRNWF